MALEKLLANNLVQKKTVKRKRVGRWTGSGNGNYSGKGLKGQNARSGGGVGNLFEGGQTVFYRKLPKYKGIKPKLKNIEVVNLQDLNVFDEGVAVDKNLLKEKGLIRTTDSVVKILAKGKLEKKLTVTDDIELFSKSAQAILKKAA